MIMKNSIPYVIGLYGKEMGIVDKDTGIGYCVPVDIENFTDRKNI
jgi:uncharacterized ferredoxin-like protein